jgi:hypothetical protein
LQERNAMLAALAHEPAQRTAWVIVGAPGQKVRQWWCNALGVQAEDLVVLVPPLAELQRRIMGDPERKRICDLQLQWVDQWMMREMAAR